MQGDGNLVAYKPGGTSSNNAIWATGTNGRGSSPWSAVMQDDCNFVVYGKNNEALWNSNTTGRQDET